MVLCFLQIIVYLFAWRSTSPRFLKLLWVLSKNLTHTWDSIWDSSSAGFRQIDRWAAEILPFVFLNYILLFCSTHIFDSFNQKATKHFSFFPKNKKFNKVIKYNIVGLHLLKLEIQKMNFKSTWDVWYQFSLFAIYSYDV